MKNYAVNNGTTHYKKVQMRDELGQIVERDLFDYYEPKKPDEYVFIIVDHVSLLDPENGLKERENIMKLSKYMVELRNKYNYSPVVVQQQSTETQSLEAFKSNKIRPTVTGLSDSKYTGRDCQIMLGITNPHSHELPEYLGYNIKKLKDKARFLEIVINRNGIANSICPLYFEGATCTFRELPKPNDTEAISKVYEYNERCMQNNTNLFAFSKYSDKLKRRRILHKLFHLFH